MPESANDLNHWIILFRSIHHVLATERVLKERGIWFDLVPASRELTSECSMAIRFDGNDVEAVKAILAVDRVHAHYIYERQGGVYRDRTDMFDGLCG